jgi:hypothetical protein
VIVVGTFGPEQVAAHGTSVTAAAQTMSADLRPLLDHYR